MPDTAEPDPRAIPSCLDLFLGFMTVAAFAFGGVLPWVRYVVVDQKRWMTQDEFIDTLSLCQLLPGPNIINLSVALGARFHGPLGSLSAALGLLALPIVIVLTLAGLYGRFANVVAVQGALAAMGAAAAGLLVAMAIKFAEPMLRKRFWSSAPVIVGSFVAVGLLRAPLWLVILAVGPVAILLAWRERT